MRRGGVLLVALLSSVVACALAQEVGFNQTSYMVAEDAGTVSVCIDTTSTPASVNVTTVDGTASAGEDYMAVDEELDIMSSPQCVEIMIIDDMTVVQGPRTFTVELTSDDPTVMLTVNTTTVTITDTTRVDVGYVNANYTVNENAGTVGVCVETTGATTLERDVVVTLSTVTGGSATADDDYTLTTVDLTFSSSQTQNCTDIPIVNDTVVESTVPETIMLLIESSDTVDIAQDSATVSITDTTQVTVGYVNAPYTVDEDAGTVEVCVSVTGATLARDVVVTLSTVTGGSATADDDYTLTTTDLTFSMSSTQECADIPIVNDGVVESTVPETITLMLTTTDSAANIAQPSATVSITDTTQVTVGYVNAPYTVDEDAGTVQVCVETTGATTLARDVVVTLSTVTGGTATADDDYTLTTVDLTFSSSQTQDCADIPIVDDTVVESTVPETITLMLTSSDSANIAQPTTTTVTINDQTRVDVGYVNANYTVNENAGTVGVCVETTGATLERDVIVTLSTVTGGTATAGDDYTLTTVDLTFSMSSTQDCADIPIDDDGVVESTVPETITLMLTTTDSAANIAQPSATVSITDTTQVTVGYVNAPYTVDEDAGTVQVCVETTGATTLARDVVVTLSTVTGGTATAGDDYTLTTVDLTFSSSQTQDCGDIPIVDDTVVESTVPETITLMLTSSDSANIAQPTTTTVTINDQTRVDVGYVNANYTVNENAGTVGVCVETTGATLARDVVVTLSTVTGGTATAGDDYTLTTVDLTFSMSSTQDCADIPIDDDGVVESTDPETIMLMLTTSDTAVDIAQDSATVSINDTTQVTVNYVGAPYTVDEDAGTVEVCVETTGATLERDVMVTLSTVTGGSATGGGTDYQDLSPTVLTFSDTTTRNCENITIVDDVIVEDAETIMLMLTPADSAASFPQSSATITITDTSTVMVVLERDSYTVDETDGMVMVCAEISGMFDRDVTVGLSTGPASAMATADYNPTPQPSTLTFSPSRTTRECATIIIEDDGVNEVAAEQFSVSLDSPVDSAVMLGTPSAATITIVDPPVIMTQPMNRFGVLPDEGINVTFTVVALGSDLTYQWQRGTSDSMNFMNITDDSVKYSGTDTATLTVRNITVGDGGSFRCVVSNAALDITVTSNPARLTILGPPSITSGPMDTVVESGEEAVLECSGDGVGNLTFTWETTASNTTLPDPVNSVSSAPPPALNNGTSVLTLSMVDLDNGGEYTCRVSNDRGDAESQANLTVILFVGDIQDQSVNLRDNVTFDCSVEVSGTDSDPTYSWTADGETVRDTGNSCDIDEDFCISGSNTGVLTIMNVGPENAGLYNCSVSLDGTAVAYRNASLTTLLPTFVTEPLDVVVDERGEFTVNCSAQNRVGASGLLQFQWLNRTDLVVLQNEGRITITSSGEDENRTATSMLTISNVTISDAGEYACEVNNRFFRDAIISNFTVEVLFAPVVTFVDGDDGERLTGDERRNVSTNLTLSCSAEGNPPVTSIEIRNGSVVLANASGNQVQFLLSNLQLTVSSTYSCVAYNGDTTTVNFTLIVQDVPGMVDHDLITAVNVTLITVDLSWEAPESNNADIIRYCVAFCKISVSVTNCINSEESRCTPDATPEITLVELTPDRTYSVFIQAENGVGLSERPADPFLFYTASVDDVPPENLVVEFVTQNSVLLSWTIPPLAMSPVVISSYNLVYFVSGSLLKRNETVEFMVGPQGTFVDGLDAETVYNFTVALVFSDPDRLTGVSAEISDQTLAEAPNLQDPTTDADGNQITVSWDPPTEGFEFLLEYVVQFTITPLSSRRKRQFDGAMNLTVLRNVNLATISTQPHTRNDIRVVGRFLAGGESFLSPITDPTVVDTDQQRPTAPLDLDITSPSYRFFDLEWMRPDTPNGVISQYTVYYTPEGGSENTVDVPVDSRTATDPVTYRLENLEPGTRYTITVSATTGGGEGERSNQETGTTLLGVVMPTVALNDDRTVLINTLNTSFGDLSHFFVIVFRRTSQPSTSNTSVPDDTLNPFSDAQLSRYSYYVALTVAVTDVHTSGPTRLTLGDNRETSQGGVTYQNVGLEGGQTYFVAVRLYSSRRATLSSTSEASGPLSIAESSSSSDAAVAIIVPIAVIALLLLIVFIVLLVVAIYTRTRGSGVRRRHHFLEDGADGKKAVELRRTRLFSPVLNVGSPDVFTSAGQPTTLICEASGTPAPEISWTRDGQPLDKERFIQLADSSLFINDTDLQDEGSYLVTAINSAGSTEQMVRVTVLRPVPPEPDSAHLPIPIGNFSEKLALLKANDDEGLEDEYADIDLDWNFTSYAAKLGINKNKNRYVNIIPYDHSRVALSLQDHTPGSDYINGSFIDAYNKPNGYIATQGPIPSTFPDFWRMVWELDCPTIIMVTNLKEDDKVKCHQYWPSYGTTTYGNVQVTLKEVENLAEYSIRTFNISPLAGTSKVSMPMREVRQFHFVVWPDHGVPQFATALLSFRKRVHKYHPDKRGPMVIHCSAGVGRTGTFIAVDYALDQIEAEGVVDIFNVVRHMRYRRNYMIQTAPQYVFSYTAVLEALMCGDTSIQAPQLREKLHQLQETDPNTGKTHFNLQFETLVSASPTDDDFDCTIAELPDNAGKNRFKEHLPANEFRVVLSTDNDQSDYICASFVDGYRQRNAFIVTQGPMEPTKGDLWRMVWEHKSAAIVMLTDIEEKKEEMSVKYWPGEVGQPEVYGLFQVELSAGERDLGDYTTRRFKLSPIDKPQESRMVTQFHFTRWTQDSPPGNTKSIIDLIDELQRVQRKSGNGPITVHCNDGIGRTGAFCTLYSVLERVKTEQVVDVFQAVKTLRIQRAGLLKTLNQYEFVHRAVLEFLDSFADYQNFK